MLNTIIEEKRAEVAQRKIETSLSELIRRAEMQRDPVSLRKALTQVVSSGIIAEFKRRSPSKGPINAQAEVVPVTQAYVQAGAAVLSVLTDTAFFGGSLNDLAEARAANACPILRKDFIIDEYQIVEARAYGADVILLIAACLDKQHLRSLAQLAKSLGMEVLLEVHEAAELDHYNPFVDAIGVNNRNLKTFAVSVDTSFELLDQLPVEAIKISESGLDNPETVLELLDKGYQGFLMGEYFMKQQDPGQACSAFIEQIRHSFLKTPIA
ncbi:MAG TPA: indole-3-glycerol phosphate synthase TrpC [Saprospiraceae bacterium]|nr:indole-3-glycerol phosphate synthase TrpC [Saprospiraceae bacterium]HMQ84488.1 indole-3-glycerol phosphate synthase TrpC [Saprospiraceae bacterium]